MSVTIYHNPRCATSRNALAMIRDSGVEPNIIKYLETPPDRDTLRRLARDSGLGVRGLLRAKEGLHDQLELGDPSLSDDQLLDAIEAHPILLNRPIVVGPKGTRLARPSEKVLEILDDPPESFVKEDGEVVGSSDIHQDPSS